MGEDTTTLVPVLAAAGVAVPAHLSHVDCDFLAPDFEAALTAGLEASGFRRGAGALFVWEGVLAYIDGAARDRSLRFMTGVGGPGSRVVFDFSPLGFDPESADEITRRAGFTAFEAIGIDALWRRHLPGEPPENARACFLGVASV